MTLYQIRMGKARQDARSPHPLHLPDDVRGHPGPRSHQDLQHSAQLARRTRGTRRTGEPGRRLSRRRIYPVVSLLDAPPVVSVVSVESVVSLASLVSLVDVSSALSEICPRMASTGLAAVPTLT